MKRTLLLSTSVAAVLSLTQAPAANASTIVGTVYGSYDALCSSNIDCSFGTGYTVNNMAGTNPYDTPNLFIVNSGSTSFTGMSLKLTGYQADNNGLTATLTLPDVPSHTILMIPWDSQTPSSGSSLLFRYDYDDEYGTTAINIACAAVGYGDCADVGNFDTLISGTVGSTPIASDFSPSNTQDGGNQAGMFVGWEGIDPNGWSESTYDAHSGTTPGVLAYIYTGTTGKQTSVPEPLSISLFGAGLGALSIARRRRKKS